MFFYFTSTPSYKECFGTQKLMKITTCIVVIILVLCASINATMWEGLIPKDTCLYHLLQIVTLVEPAFLVILGIATAYLVNSDFYKYGLDKDISKDKAKFNLVKNLIHMSIAAATIEALINTKIKCHILNSQKIECDTNLKCFWATDPFWEKKFLDEYTQNTKCCEIFKYAYYEYCIIREDIEDYFKHASIHFPELSDILYTPYKKYVIHSQKYECEPFTYYNFFDEIKNIPIKIEEQYAEDEQFKKDMAKEFQSEYEEYERKSLYNCQSIFQLDPDLTISREEIFKPFEKFLQKPVS